jgi:hypothetical protein
VTATIAGIGYFDKSGRERTETRHRRTKPEVTFYEKAVLSIPTVQQESVYGSKKLSKN